jgi:ABC-2 type transport system ATP-binding protein
MTPAISVAGLTRRYRGSLALDAVSFDIEPGSVTGLLGRNGAGKTTLLRLVAGQEFPSAGGVRVLGACPVENEKVLHRMVFVREDQRYPDYGAWPAFQVRHALQTASWFYPNWDANLAAALAEDFGLPPGRRVAKLSRGMRSALGIVIGLAARAEVTLFDEPYAGLDPVARKLFYDRLLADYAEHPRTVLLSTHLIDEAAGLMERILVIDHGKLVLDAPADELRGSAASVSGPAIAVAEFTAGRAVWNRRRAGSRESAVVAGGLDDGDRARARSLRLHVEPLTLQQVVVYASGAPAADTPDTRERTSA